MVQFKWKYRMSSHDTRATAGGIFDPETLPRVVSIAEEENRADAKREASRQMGLDLDSQLTIQARKRSMARMPSPIEKLRTK